MKKIQNIYFLQTSCISLLLLCCFPFCLFSLTFLQYFNLSCSFPTPPPPFFCSPSFLPYHRSLPPFPAGERVLASGSVQLPRFTLLESGSLLISPSHLSDAGTYTCMASNSRGIDEASADLLVWGKRNSNWTPSVEQNRSFLEHTIRLCDLSYLSYSILISLFIFYIVQHLYNLLKMMRPTLDLWNMRKNKRRKCLFWYCYY